MWKEKGPLEYKEPAQMNGVYTDEQAEIFRRAAEANRFKFSVLQNPGEQYINNGGTFSTVGVGRVRIQVEVPEHPDFTTFWKTVREIEGQSS